MNKPYIVLKVMASLDGRISINPNLNMWEDMGDPRNKAEGGGDIWKVADSCVKSIHKPEADMLGSNSLIKEGEELRELPAYEGDPGHLYQDFLPEEVINRPDKKGWLVVVDGRGRLRSGYKGEDNPGWHMLHLVSHGVPAEYLAFLQKERIPYLIAGEKQVNLAVVMEKMKSKLNVNCMETSAGGRLSGAMLRAGVIDEINIIFKPYLYGGFETPSLFDSPELKEEEWPTKLTFISCQTSADGYVWLRYKVDKKG